MRILYWLLGLEETGTIHSAAEWTWQPSTQLSSVVISALMIAGIGAAGRNLLPGNQMPLRTRLSLVALRLGGFGLMLVMLIELELRRQMDCVVPPHVAVLKNVSSSLGLTET